MKYILCLIFGVVLTSSEVFAYQTSSSVLTREGSNLISPGFYKSNSLTHHKNRSNRANREVSLNLVGYVDSEVNIERIDNNSDVNILQNNEVRFRITCNANKSVRVTFETANNWKLLSKSGGFIPYKGIFKRDNGSETEVKAGSNSVIVDKNEFVDTSFKFRTTFVHTEKNLISGTYSDKVTVSVSTML